MESNCFGKNYLFMPSALHVIVTQFMQFKQWMSKPVTGIFSSQILEF